MSKKSPKENTVQIEELRVRLFEAAAQIDRGDEIYFDCRGTANPYEQMYDRHGVSDRRPRRQR